MFLVLLSSDILVPVSVAMYVYFWDITECLLAAYVKTWLVKTTLQQG
jgi:hypothetical protein